MEQFHNMHAFYEYLEDGVVRLTSYSSVVADVDDWHKRITLYPRWCYSASIIRQVKRFIEEYAGLRVDVATLRAFRRDVEVLGLSTPKVGGYVFEFSNEFPQG